MNIKKIFKFTFITLLVAIHIIVSLLFTVILSAIIYNKSQSFTSTDYNLYLSNGTYFEETASLVLPSKNALDKAEIVKYQYDYSPQTFIFTSHITLHLSVIYSENDFNDMKNAIEEQYLKQDECHQEKFYHNGNLYYGYIFYNNSPNNVNAYALAYTIDTDTNKITYVLNESYECQVMSAEDALSYVLD